MPSIFINYTNHPIEFWDEKQLLKTRELGDSFIDIPFPKVSPTMSHQEILMLADSEINRIKEAAINFDNAIVHIMGEHTLVYNVIRLLKLEGVKCVASTTERVTEILPSGEKISKFNFIMFREY